MVKTRSRLGILITICALSFGVVPFLPFLFFETDNLFSLKPSLKIFSNQYIITLFICFLAFSLFFYITPKHIKKDKIRSICASLSYHTKLLDKNAKLKHETKLLIRKLQHSTDKAPELTLKTLRRYAMQGISLYDDKKIFSLPQQAGIILSCLSSKNIKKISRRMSKKEIKLFQKLSLYLGDTSDEEKFTTLSQFFKILTEPIYLEKTSSFIEKTLPEQHAKSILKNENISFKKQDLWKKLNTIPAKRIAGYLTNISSQSVAIILYNLSDKKAGEVLNILPNKISINALSRLTALKSLSRKQTKRFIPSIENYFLNIFPQTLHCGLKKTSAILSIMPPHKKNKFKTLLLETKPHIAQKLSKEILCFDDIAFCDNTLINRLIKKTPEKILTLALMGANSKTKEIFSKNIPPQKWGKFLNQLNTGYNEKIKEIDEAQHFIIKKAHILLNKNKK